MFIKVFSKHIIYDPSIVIGMRQQESKDYIELGRLINSRYIHGVDEGTNMYGLHKIYVTEKTLKVVDETKRDGNEIQYFDLYITDESYKALIGEN